MRVVAVLVTDGGTPYLARTLASLAGQTRAPQRVLVVDVAEREADVSRDLTGDAATNAATNAGAAADPVADVDAGGRGQPAAALVDVVRAAGLPGPVALVRAAGAATFGAAVAHAARVLADRDVANRDIADRAGASPRHGRAREAPDLFWLLHDDSAPRSDALAEQLRLVAAGADVVGPKQRGWVEPDALLEVGLSATRTARRLDIEDDEIDQGQHDRRREVLAVGTAGMLVRTDVLEQLGGFDPALGPFGDGLEFCRRARLAGARVAVAPLAVVHHARASYEGLRGTSRAAEQPTIRRRGHPPRAEHRLPDRRRSYRARRAAQMYNALVAARPGTVLLLLVGYLIAAPLRGVWHLVEKEPSLAAAELGAAGDLLSSWSAMERARRRVDRVAVRPAAALARFEADPADIRAARREQRRHRSALVRMRQAPSELEIEERRALAAGRRGTLAVVGAVLVVAGLLLSGHLVGGLASGGALAALPATLGRTWEAARSSWIPAGLGAAGPADPLLSVLAVLAAPGALVGVAPSTSLALLLVAAPLAAGVGAWFAAGAATRSVVARAWVALVWALSPTVLLASTHGRVGVLLAAAALPWVALSVAWVTGHRRRDVLLPGLVGARRRRRRPAAGPELPAGEEQRSFDVFADLVAMDGGLPDRTRAPMTDAARADADPDTPGVQSDGGSRAVDQEVLEALEVSGDAGSRDRQDFDSFDAAPPLPGSGHNPTVSLIAAAGGGIALTIATAGVPALVPVSAIVLLLVGAVVGHGRRHLALLWAVPFVVHLPLILAVARRPELWRALLADTGVPLAARPAGGPAVLLGWPEDPGFVDSLRTPLVPGATVQLGEVLAWAWLPVVLLALAALLAAAPARRHRTGVAVRLAWALVALGVVTHLLVTRVVVAPGTGGAGAPDVVTAWGGAGTLVVTGGLLMALAAADGARHHRRAWTRATHGGDPYAGAVGAHRRSVVARSWAAVAGAAVLALVPLAGAAAVIGAAVSSDRPVVEARGPRVPALSVQSAEGPERGRTLLIDRSEDVLVGRLLRGDGPLLTETSTLASAAAVVATAQGRESAAGAGSNEDPGTGGSDDSADIGAADPLRAEATGAAASLATGGSDAARRLADLGVSVVVVPPVEDTGTARRDHDDLVRTLDGAAGLERVTVNDTGTVWRIAEDAARARVVEATGAQGGSTTTTLPAGEVRVATSVDPDDVPAEGGLLVLAERSDAGWSATLDGEQLEPAQGPGGAQAFVLPGGGRLEVDHHAPGHLPVGLLQVVVVLTAALAAVPARRGGPL